MAGDQWRVRARRTRTRTIRRGYSKDPTWIQPGHGVDAEQQRQQREPLHACTKRAQEASRYAKRPS